MANVGLITIAYGLRAKQDVINVEWLFYTLAISPDGTKFVSGTTKNYIRITDLTDDGKLRIKNPRFIDLDAEKFNKYKVYDGDILIARS
ncbi:MAG: hypothetical protein N3B16_04005 [Candidatus Aminicenantes bacterium]|nr:hypothetical protein [Candidatus Aminicenantes bacterium]